jgi:hypothetical protein
VVNATGSCPPITLPDHTEDAFHAVNDVNVLDGRDVCRCHRVLLRGSRRGGIKGATVPRKFTGTRTHSGSPGSADIDVTRVLVLGSGNSGCDVRRHEFVVTIGRRAEGQTRAGRRRRETQLTHPWRATSGAEFR